MAAICDTSADFVSRHHHQHRGYPFRKNLPAPYPVGALVGYRLVCGARTVLSFLLRYAVCVHDDRPQSPQCHFAWPTYHRGDVVVQRLVGRRRQAVCRVDVSVATDAADAPRRRLFRLDGTPGQYLCDGLRHYYRGLSDTPQSPHRHPSGGFSPRRFRRAARDDRRDLPLPGRQRPRLVENLSRFPPLS